ncbi:MAG: hypothetical protein EVA65_16040 [Oceanococcus sp.]|nr:MAG: hypothetical protein EVA65_16040 [Oceanococcus sp.]
MSISLYRVKDHAKRWARSPSWIYGEIAKGNPFIPAPIAPGIWDSREVEEGIARYIDHCKANGTTKRELKANTPECIAKRVRARRSESDNRSAA